MRIRILVVTALAFLLAGCAGSGASSGPSVDPSPTAEPGLTKPLVPLTAPEVLEYCPSEEAVHFDGDVAAVDEVYVCSGSDMLSVDGQAPGIVPGIQRASRVAGGLDALLAAYAKPNAGATAEACIELAADPLIVWVKSSDTITPVYAPVDECGFPTDAAAEAFTTVRLETIVEVSVDDAAPSPATPDN